MNTIPDFLPPLPPVPEGFDRWEYLGEAAKNRYNFAFWCPAHRMNEPWKLADTILPSAGVKGYYYIEAVKDSTTSKAAADLRAALGDDEPRIAPLHANPAAAADLRAYPDEETHVDLREDLELATSPFDDRIHLKHLLRAINDVKLRAACHELLGFPEFFTWPAAISHHHAYEGGLLKHTLEVADIALHIATKFPQVNRDVLIAAALWHDWGKTLEYVKVPLYAAVDSRTRHLPIGDEAWIYDNNARHHILTSTQEFVVVARKHGVDKATEDAVVHCILSHHGPVKEWGSPEAPRTIEAIILHQADYLSAQAGATKEKA